MSSLGILQASLRNESLYINQIALAAVKKGIQVYKLTPFSYVEKEKLVIGKRFDETTQCWQDQSFSLPKYIYDRFFYPKNRNIYPLIRKRIKYLQKEAIFLGKGLPNKWEVYKYLYKHEILKKFLPKTEQFSSHSLAYFFQFTNQLILKPTFSSGGRGIYLVFKEKDRFAIFDGKNKIHHTVIGSTEDLYHFLRTQLCHENYLVQTLLSLCENNQPMDVRIVMQKNTPNTWNLIGSGVRVGKKGTFISNLQAGGKVQLTHPRSPSIADNEELMMIITLLPPYMENNFYPLFELGIDIGIDNNGKAWILEVNSKPGYKTIFSTASNNTIEKLLEGPATYINNLELLTRSKE